MFQNRDVDRIHAFTIKNQVREGLQGDAPEAALFLVERELPRTMFDRDDGRPEFFLESIRHPPAGLSLVVVKNFIQIFLDERVKRDLHAFNRRFRTPFQNSVSLKDFTRPLAIS